MEHWRGQGSHMEGKVLVRLRLDMAATLGAGKGTEG